jgi:Ca2+-binding RTX toxin-like protein
MVMRRSIVVLVPLALAVMLLVSGVALARNIGGDENDNILRGTKRADTIHGRGGDDVVHGRAGNDRIYGENDQDTLYGGKGRDRIYSAGAHADVVDCGRDRRDWAEVDASDQVVRCERVVEVTP